MSRFRYIFIGFLATFATAWLGLVIAPSLQYGKEAAALPEVALTPEMSLIREGERVYAANGCIYCHSQQLRSNSFGSDVARFWGTRRTVAADYLGDGKAMLGTMRTGPDLSNIGQRMASPAWHYQHLYNPVSTSPGSIMPAYQFLFEKVPVVDGKPDPDALAVGAGGDRIDADGMQLVPTLEGRALVAYLLSLKRTSIDRPEAAEAPIR
ncbi:MAG: cbb3-type cytochrome c oxidase subunit II [Akkermansiaceae bacterium]